MIVDSLRVEPLTIDRFDGFVAVVGKSGIGGCWCMYWTFARLGFDELQRPGIPYGCTPSEA